MQKKNHTKKIGLAILAIFIIQTSFGQENYIPGYVISAGDTLRGYIDYRNWEGNPEKISFKEKPSDNAIVYTPSDIKGFGVSGEFYESAVVETDISPKNINNVTDDAYFNPDLKTETVTAFLQTLIRGKKSLFYYMNKMGKDQFYIWQDSGYKLLIYKKYLKRQEEAASGTAVAENRKYTGQLLFYLQDCPSIQLKLKNIEYSKKSMKDLFDYYYDCTQSKFDFQKKTEKTVLEFGILSGLSLTSVKFNAIDFLKFADLNLSSNLLAGIFFEVIPPRNRGKWSLNNELTYSSYKTTGRYNDFESENKYTIYNSTIGFSYLKMNNMIRYKYLIGDYSIYANAGISNGYAISETNYLKKEYKIFWNESTSEGKALNETRKYEQGYLLGLGTKFRNYGFEFRYEKGNGMSVSRQIKATTTKYNFILSYKF